MRERADGPSRTVPPAARSLPHRPAGVVRRAGASRLVGAGAQGGATDTALSPRTPAGRTLRSRRQPACCSHSEDFQRSSRRPPGICSEAAGGTAGPTFLWHEQLGIAVAIGATLTWAGWMAAHRSGHDALMTMVYRGLLAATLIVVGIASHLGATLTHGEGYLTEHAPSAMQRWFGLSGSSLASGVTRPDQAVAYSTLVQPILDRRCVSCHGPITAEGKLRLDTLEGIRKGGGDGPVIVPGARPRARSSAESGCPRHTSTRCRLVAETTCRRRRRR